MAIESVLPAAGSWLWSNYGKNIADKVFSVGKQKWDSAKWETAAKAYCSKLIKLYDSMQIMGMVEPVPLEDLFTDLYLLDKPTAFHRFNIEHLKEVLEGRRPPPKVSRVNGIELISEKIQKRIVEKKKKSGTRWIEVNRNFFILGKPGAGKTTFLKYVAVQAAQQKIDKVPIFISLKEWADSRLDLLLFIIKRFEVCNFPNGRPFVEELLKSGNAMVLFDGLDEVNQELGQRDEQTRRMKEFVEQYDSAQYLITCRVAATDYTFEPFTYVEIADFTEEQIGIFVANWFRNRKGEKDEETCNRFLVEFDKEENAGLRDLARTPLLLTLLCLAFNETLTFPQRRVEIYGEALDALLKKWDSTRRIKRDEVYRKLSLGHKENMLAHIAAATFEKNRYFIPQSELEKLITMYVRNVPPHDTTEIEDGTTILKSIESQHGIFVERAREIYSFSHLTFQEYFTSKYVVANFDRNELAKFIEHSTDRRWREVFLLTASLLSDATEFVSLFRQWIDELIANEPNLQKLLKHVLESSNAIQKSARYVRAYYLYVNVYQLSQNLSLDRALERTLTRALYAARDGAIARAFEKDISEGLVRANSRVKILYRTTNRTTSRGHGALDQARRHVSVLTDLKKELSLLSLPKHHDGVAGWNNYAAYLRELIVAYNESATSWRLTDEEESVLEAYLDSADLLQDCLELAFMPPDEKTAMLASLYLPPGFSE